MTIELDGIEGLTEEQIAAIQEKTKGFVPESEIEGLKRNRDELLEEKKAAAEARAKAEELAKAKELEAAKAAGDIGTLEKSYKEKLAAYERKEKEQLEQIKKDRISSKSMELAAELADGANAKLLNRFIRDRLDFRENEIKVLDKDGQLTVSSIDDLKEEFRNSSDFASLITANKATGGGAKGSNSGGATAKNLKDIPVNDKQARQAAIKQRLQARGH